MKRFISYFIFFIFCNSLFSQDLICFTDQKMIEVKIIRIGEEETVYRLYKTTGPDRVIRNSEINFMVGNSTGNIIYMQWDPAIPIPDSLYDNLPTYGKFKNMIGSNYVDLFFTSLNLSYERLFPKERVSLKLSVSAGMNGNNYNFTFLGFDQDYLRSFTSFSFYPIGIRPICFFTGLSLLTGIGYDKESIQVFEQTPWGPISRWEDRMIRKQYWGYHFVNGIQVNIGPHLVMKGSFMLGVVNKDSSRGNFMHPYGEFGTFIRF